MERAIPHFSLQVCWNPVSTYWKTWDVDYPSIHVESETEVVMWISWIWDGVVAICKFPERSNSWRDRVEVEGVGKKRWLEDEDVDHQGGNGEYLENCTNSSIDLWFFCFSMGRSRWEAHWKKNGREKYIIYYQSLRRKEEKLYVYLMSLDINLW